MNSLKLEGQRFGKLTVIKQMPNNKIYTEWLCKCDCGNENFVARGTRLKQGISDSCGCERANKVSKANTKHGMRNTPIYHVWVSMKQRCDNPNSTSSKHYHDKGITYCDEWKDFNNFYKDMGETYFESAFLDRKDNNLGYCKENCRWVNVTESNRNKTTTLTPEKVKQIRESNKSRVELMKEFGVSYMTIKKILTYQTWKEI